MKNILALLLLLVLFTNCDSIQSDPDLELLSIAPTMDSAQCIHNTYESYNFSLSSYVDSPNIKYYISNTPYKIDRQKTEEVLDRAFSMWAEQVKKPIIPTADSTSADIAIDFQYIDGKEGSLGQSQFPPSHPMQLTPIKMTFDKYDVHGADGGAHDFFSIALHEVGHSLGLRHSQNNQAVMYPFYRETPFLHLDDIMGSRIKYRNNGSFEYGKHDYIYITDEKDRITSNFRMSEFFTRCISYDHKYGHFLDSVLIQGIQMIRDEIGVPIVILSSFRPYECNMAVGGAKSSQHRFNNAIDFQFTSRAGYHRYKDEIMKEGCLFQTLLTIGISGFGGYSNSFHIDTRDHGSRSFGPFKYSMWGVFNPMALSVENCEEINS